MWPTAVLCDGVHAGGAIRSRSLSLVDAILTAVRAEGSSRMGRLPAHLLDLPHADPPLVMAAATGATSVVQRLMEYQSTSDWLHIGSNGDTALMRCVDAPPELADEDSLVLTAQVNKWSMHGYSTTHKLHVWLTHHCFIVVGASGSTGR